MNIKEINEFIKNLGLFSFFVEETNIHTKNTIIIPDQDEFEHLVKFLHFSTLNQDPLSPHLSIPVFYIKNGRNRILHHFYIIKDGFILEHRIEEDIKHEDKNKR